MNHPIIALKVTSKRFIKIVRVRKKNYSKWADPKSLADESLDYIGKLYQIEKEAKGLQLDVIQIYQLRQEKSKPFLEKSKKWLDTKQPLTSPKGLLEHAIGYPLANRRTLSIPMYVLGDRQNRRRLNDDITVINWDEFSKFSKNSGKN